MALTASPAVLRGLFLTDAPRSRVGEAIALRLENLMWVIMWSARPVLAAVPDVLGRVAAALDYMVTAPAGSPDALAGGVAFLCALDLVKEVAVVQPTALRQSAAVLTSIVTAYRSVAQRLLEKPYVRVRVHERVRTLITMAVEEAWRVVANCPQVLSGLVDDIASSGGWRRRGQRGARTRRCRPRRGGGTRSSFTSTCSPPFWRQAGSSPTGPPP